MRENHQWTPCRRKRGLAQRAGPPDRRGIRRRSVRPWRTTCPTLNGSAWRRSRI